MKTREEIYDRIDELLDLELVRLLTDKEAGELHALDWVLGE